jgi:hypothetical protein
MVSKNTKKEVAQWAVNPFWKGSKELVKGLVGGTTTPLTDEQLSAWDTTSGGPPPGTDEATWRMLPASLKAELASKVNAAKSGGAASSDVADDSYVEERQQRTDEFLNGSPQDNLAYAQDTYDHQLFAQALGGDPNAVITRNGQPLLPPAMEQPGALAAVSRADHGALAQQQSFVDQLIGRNTGITDHLGAQFEDFNAEDRARVDELASTLGGINQSPWEALPPSVAAQAYADPESIAAQNEALDMLFGAANGSMDAHSNPQDVAAQQQALDMLFGAAGGSLDAHTNPEDLARQTQAADKWWGLSDPEITAEEKFIYEKQRLVEEQDRRASMDAALRNLSSRGMLSSGHEIGAMLGSQQQTSQNRLLGDLGAQANAIARSQNSLAQYSNLATNMRNASDALTAGNMTRRLGGMNGAATQSSNMRNASDAMASGNMNRRLSATTGAGNLASNMRDSSFSEAYKRGEALDLAARLNQTSKQQHDQFGVDLGVKKAGMISDARGGATTAASNRASQLADAGLRTSGQQFAAQSYIPGMQRDIASDEFNRGLLGIQLQNQSSKDAQENAQLASAIATINQPAPKSWFDKGLDWLTG